MLHLDSYCKNLVHAVHLNFFAVCVGSVKLKFHGTDTDTDTASSGGHAR